MLPLNGIKVLKKVPMNCCIAQYSYNVKWLYDVLQYYDLNTIWMILNHVSKYYNTGPIQYILMNFFVTYTLVKKRLKRHNYYKNMGSCYKIWVQNVFVIYLLSVYVTNELNNIIIAQWHMLVFY